MQDAEIAAKLGADAPLMPFYAALWQRETGANKVVPVLQLGDSHTASDALSGRLRELFQQDFGDAGRGLLPPGIPYRYYRPARVLVTASGWTTIPSADPHAAGPFGLAGLRQHAEGPAVMTVTAPDHADLDDVEVEFLRRPGGGGIALEQNDAAPVPVRTDGPPGVVWASLPASRDRTEFAVRARGDGPVDVLGWRFRRGTPGATWANLGTIGATVTLLDRWDEAIVRDELAHLAPALIVIAFGTNEGFRDATDPVTYEAQFAARLRALHAASPEAALLVIGPPDGARRRKKTDAETADCGDRDYATPPRLAAVRAAQRSAAEHGNAVFWDWQTAMGGACSMLRWASADPPMAAPDHIHLLMSGYRSSAEALFRTIMEGYAHYRRLRGAPARPVS